jgi:hypothetical protein
MAVVEAVVFSLELVAVLTQVAVLVVAVVLVGQTELAEAVVALIVLALQVLAQAVVVVGAHQVVVEELGAKQLLLTEKQSHGFQVIQQEFMGA